MSMLRETSFTEYLEFDFQGTVCRNAICLCDADNDGLNELIVGNEKGDVGVFKDDCGKPFYMCKTTGIITAICSGDILNIGKNIVIVITACGQCSLFDIDKNVNNDTGKKMILPFHVQRIPANVKTAFVSDVNGDGFTELILALTDRVVRTFRWVSVSKSLKDPTCGKFVGLNKWEFAEQIGSIALHHTVKGVPCILVAQPSGSFITLIVEASEKEHLEALDESISDFLTDVSVNLEPLRTSKLRNSEMCGNLNMNNSENSHEVSLAIVTLDGHFILVKNNALVWKHSFENELFTVHSINISNDGSDAVIACAWDGNTYIIKENSEITRFSFHDSVCTFTAGHFGVDNQQRPCFVYVTFNNKVYLYYDVYVNDFPSKTLIGILSEDETYVNAVQSLGIDLSDTEKLRKFNANILYNHTLDK